MAAKIARWTVISILAVAIVIGIFNYVETGRTDAALEAGMERYGQSR